MRATPLPPELGIDFGEPTSRMYRGEGWDREEEISGARANWSNARLARVLVPAAAPVDYHLSFSALPFFILSAPARTVTVIVNGQVRLPPMELSPGWTTYTLDVPTGALKMSLNQLDFELPMHAPPVR